MSRLVQLLGRTFGRLTVLSRAGSSSANKAMWLCRCECGVEKVVVGGDLLSFRTKSCGCFKKEQVIAAQKRRRRDVSGERFGRLVVIEKDGGEKWLCVCDCGNTTSVWTGSLVSGGTQSCGCLRFGEGNPNWRGGVTPIHESIRKCAKYFAWRALIFERDNYTCVLCGDNRGGNLNADHIYRFAWILEDHQIRTLEEAFTCSLLWDINNGRTLCVPCHKKTETWGSKNLKRAA